MTDCSGVCRVDSILIDDANLKCIKSLFTWYDSNIKTYNYCVYWSVMIVTGQTSTGTIGQIQAILSRLTFCITAFSNHCKFIYLEVLMQEVILGSQNPSWGHSRQRTGAYPLEASSKNQGNHLLKGTDQGLFFDRIFKTGIGRFHKEESSKTSKMQQKDIEWHYYKKNYNSVFCEGFFCSKSREKLS